MSEQLALLGESVPLEAETKPLTVYQAAVLDHVNAHPDGVTADECGAIAHSLKPERPHDRDARCDWCGKGGTQILKALGKKGLVRRRQGGGHFIYCPTGPSSESAQPGPGDLPEGF